MFEDRIAALNQANTEKMAIESTQYDKRTYTVDEIQDILGISRTSAYNLVKKNYFRCVRIGGTIRISKKSFDEWLDQQI
ncbi:helix-turn-helix domain-containing protein [Faecalibacterium prausnitzii]|jgi:excisionase family DNA binding protein|uniref:helix-turn-helix domain-containing protein n=1 Tax=Faecalibacterium prausnitzii TaxID=853 RepID=UPI0022E37ECA|nr:helix-turn-helix domain-containing protein [Faecalibacterium prausnitzii]